MDLELDSDAGKKEYDYVCPVFLHKDESNVARYFVTHKNGVHCVNVPSIHELQKFIASKNGNQFGALTYYRCYYYFIFLYIEDETLLDVFKEPSTIDHLVCSKNAVTDKKNPVIGFSLYYEPTSAVALLANGELVSLALMSAALLPPLENLEICDAEELQSPLKKVNRLSIVKNKEKNATSLF